MKQALDFKHKDYTLVPCYWRPESNYHAWLCNIHGRMKWLSLWWAIR